ncbi:MAG TPA: hypothetical protein DD734_13280, partial [Firmicutes bacterium]|nr:hypothetical protein [Bacillota bacterium]
MKFTSIKKRLLIRAGFSLIVLMVLCNLLWGTSMNLFLKIVLNLFLIGTYLKLIEKFFDKGLLKPIYLIN